jgi:phage regulator Rha-like protein
MLVSLSLEPPVEYAAPGLPDAAVRTAPTPIHASGSPLVHEPEQPFKGWRHVPDPTHGIRTLEVKGYEVPMVGVKEPADPYVVSFPDHNITEKIHYIRGQKVMLDRDLAELYGVETKTLKRAVRRNLDRFPLDFMFQLTEEEEQALRYQIGTLKRGEHTKYLPFAFTEHGILMLANVLRSEQAIAVSIHIIRVFTRMRELLRSHKDLLLKIEQLEPQVQGHDQEIPVIFDHLKHLLAAPPPAPRPRIG